MVTRLLVADPAPLMRAGIRAGLYGERSVPPLGEARFSPLSASEEVLRSGLARESPLTSDAGLEGGAASSAGDMGAGPSESPPPRGIEIVAEAATGSELLALAQRTDIDVAAVDLHLEINGQSALALTKQARPDWRIVALGSCDNAHCMQQAFTAGAQRFFFKAGSIHQLRKTIADCRQTSPDDPHELTPPPGSRIPPLDAWESAGLTRREEQVLRLIVVGQRNKQIAESLRISDQTVKEHVQHLLAKLHVADRMQAAVWAVRNGRRGM